MSLPYKQGCGEKERRRFSDINQPISDSTTLSPWGLMSSIYSVHTCDNRLPGGYPPISLCPLPRRGGRSPGLRNTEVVGDLIKEYKFKFQPGHGSVDIQSGVPRTYSSTVCSSK